MNVTVTLSDLERATEEGIALLAAWSDWADAEAKRAAGGKG